MSDYSLTTNKSWSQTLTELDHEFSLWGINDYETNYPKGARQTRYNEQDEADRTVTLRYKKNGHDIILSMGKQARAVDNLRVLYLAIHSLRLNEVRGIGDILESAYLQLAAPAQNRDPFEVLGIYKDSPLEIAEAVYKAKALKAHPDRGGKPEEFKQLTEAIEKIRKMNK